MNKQEFDFKMDCERLLVCIRKNIADGFPARNNIAALNNQSGMSYKRVRQLYYGLQRRNIVEMESGIIYLKETKN